MRIKLVLFRALKYSFLSSLSTVKSMSFRLYPALINGVARYNKPSGADGESGGGDLGDGAGVAGRDRDAFDFG